MTKDALAQISADIHDEYFDLDRLDFDRTAGELRIVVYPARKRGWIVQTLRPPNTPLPSPLGTLVVRQVTDVRVEDDADIGWYDIDGLEFDTESSEVVICSNFPLVIRVKVRQLDVKFET